jgi:hypothetical protein
MSGLLRAKLMVEAGLGYATYEHVADQLAEAAELIMG